MPEKARMMPVTMEDVRIVFRNFAGAQGQYNAQGDRNFAVIIEDVSLAQHMLDDGWNIKQLPAREEGDTPTDFLKVKVKFTERSTPTVVFITSRGRTTLSEDLLSMVDAADIEKVDLIIRPYEWDVQGKTGVTAYLKSIYITIREDELEMKYADVPEVQGSLGGLEYTPEEEPVWDDEG